MTLVSHSYNDRDLRSNPCSLKQSGISQGTGSLNQSSTKDAEYFVGNIKVQEPKDIKIFGRFFPHPEHRFSKRQFNTGVEIYFNKGIDSRPDWFTVLYCPKFNHLPVGNDMVDADNFIRRETTRIHLIVN